MVRDKNIIQSELQLRVRSIFTFFNKTSLNYNGLLNNQFKIFQKMSLNSGSLKWSVDCNLTIPSK